MNFQQYAAASGQRPGQFRRRVERDALLWRVRAQQQTTDTHRAGSFTIDEPAVAIHMFARTKSPQSRLARQPGSRLHDVNHGRFQRRPAQTGVAQKTGLAVLLTRAAIPGHAGNKAAAVMNDVAQRAISIGIASQKIGACQITRIVFHHRPFGAIAAELIE